MGEEETVEVNIGEEMPSLLPQEMREDLISTLLLFLHVVDDKPAAQDIFQLESALFRENCFKNDNCEYMTLLANMLMQHRNFLRAVLDSTFVCPSQVPLFPSLLNLPANPAKAVTDWEDAANRLDEVATETSCIFAWDGVVDNIKRAIKAFYKSTREDQIEVVVWTLDESILLLRLVHKYLPTSVVSSSNSNLPLRDFVPIWYRIAEEFRNSVGTSATDSQPDQEPKARSTRDQIGPLSCFAQWLTLWEAISPVVESRVFTEKHNVDKVKFAFAFINFIRDEGDCDDIKIASSLGQGARYASRILAKKDESNAGIFALKIVSAMIQIWYHGSDNMVASESRLLSFEQAKSVVKAFRKLLSTIKLHNVDQIFSFGFWNGLSKLANRYLYNHEDDNVTSLEWTGGVETRGLQYSSSSCTEELGPLMCLYWIKHHFQNVNSIWPHIEEHGMLEFVCDLVLHAKKRDEDAHCEVSESFENISVYHFSTIVSSILEKNLRSLFKYYNIDKSANMVHINPILCAVLFHLKRQSLRKNQSRTYDKNTLSASEAKDLLVEKICQDLFSHDFLYPLSPSGYNVEASVGKDIGKWLVVATVANSPNVTSSCRFAGQHQIVTPSDYFNVWSVLSQNCAAKFNSLPSIFKELFLLCLNRISVESSEISSSDSPEQQEIMRCMRQNTMKHVHTLVEKLVLVCKSCNVTKLVYPSNKDFFDALSRSMNPSQQEDMIDIHIECLKTLSDVPQSRRSLGREEFGLFLKQLELQMTTSVPAPISIGNSVFSVFSSIESKYKDSLTTKSNWSKLCSYANSRCLLPWQPRDVKHLANCLEKYYKAQQDGEQSQQAFLTWCAKLKVENWEEMSWDCFGYRVPLECFLMALNVNCSAFNSSSGELTRDSELINQWDLESDQRLGLLFRIFYSGRLSDNKPFELSEELVEEAIGEDKKALSCIARWYVLLQFFPAMEKGVPIATEIEIDGMLLDFLLIRKQLSVPELDFPLLWVFFSLSYKAEKRMMHQSYILWRNLLDTFREKRVVSTLRDYLRSTFRSSGTREALWENVQIIIESFNAANRSSGSGKGGVTLRSCLLYMVSLGRYGNLESVQKRSRDPNNSQFRSIYDEPSFANKSSRTSSSSHGIQAYSDTSITEEKVNSQSLWSVFPLSRWMELRDIVKSSRSASHALEQTMKDKDIPTGNKTLYKNVIDFLANALREVDRYRWNPFEDELILLCWEMAESARGVFVSRENCFQKFISLVGEYRATTGQHSEMSPHHHLLRLQSWLGSSSASDLRSLAQQEIWSHEEVSALRYSLRDLSYCRNEVEMWIRMSKQHLLRNHSAASCYLKTVRSPELYSNYFDWTEDDDRRLLLLYHMLHKSETDDLSCSVEASGTVFLEDFSCADNARKLHHRQYSLTALQKRSKIELQLPNWRKDFFQCGVRWNCVYLSGHKKDRLSSTTNWTLTKVQLLTSVLASSQHSHPEEYCYSVGFWEDIFKAFQTLVTNFSFVAQQSTSSRYGVDGDYNSKSHEVCAADCFLKSQEIARNAFRLHDIKKLVNYIGITKKDLISELTDEANENYWSDLVSQCQMKTLTPLECQKCYFELLQDTPSLSNWSSEMRDKLRRAVVSCEAGTTCGVHFRQGIDPDNCYGLQTSTHYSIQRHLNWSKIAKQLEDNKQVDANEKLNVDYLECFKQWHCVEYVLAIGKGHSNVGAWSPLEDGILGEYCRSVLRPPQEKDAHCDSKVAPELWVTISSYFESARSPLQCEVRWESIQGSSSLTWTDSEENDLLRAVGTFISSGQSVSWQEVAKSIGKGLQKTDDQCRDHFENRLYPQLADSEFFDVWDTNQDHMLIVEGNKCFSRSAEMLAQANITAPDLYIMQFMDWCKLCEIVGKTAYQCMKRYIHLRWGILQPDL